MTTAPARQAASAGPAAVARHLAAIAAELADYGTACRVKRLAGTPVLTTGPPAGPERRHGRHRPRHARRPGPAPGLHLRLDPGPRHHPQATAAVITAVLNATRAGPARPRRPPPAVTPPGSPRFLSCHPGWSVFWDPRYGLWRAAEDDPGSVLYAETPDTDAVISYITSCS